VSRDSAIDKSRLFALNILVFLPPANETDDSAFRNDLEPCAVKRAFLTACLWTAVSLGCGGDASTSTGVEPTNGQPSVRFVAGNSFSDTVGTVASQVSVRVVPQGGKVRSGVAVALSVTPTGDPFSGVFLSFTGQQAPPVGPSSDTTDASGQVSFRMGLGSKAGTFKVVASAPSVGQSDTMIVVILPGKAARWVNDLKDTTAYVGSPITPRMVPTDTWGNLRADVVTLSISQGPATVTNGAVVTTGVGLVTVRGSVGGIIDSMYVRSVPRGTIAACLCDRSIYGPPTLVMVGLDGSAQKTLGSSPVIDYGVEMSSAWSPDGRQIAYSNILTYTATDGHLYVADTAGNSHQILPVAGNEFRPRWSPAGDWIYYQSSLKDGSIPTNLWRVKLDGTARQQLTFDTDQSNFDVTLSPDGTQALFSTSPGAVSAAFSQLRLLSIASGKTTSFGRAGSAATWSPNGNWIAFLELDKARLYTVLSVIHPDGTGYRTISPPMVEFQTQVAWSSDSRYLVTDSSLGFVLIDTSNDTMMVLPYFSNLSSPSWRPAVP
jgi:hypothetical protein